MLTLKCVLEKWLRQLFTRLDITLHHYYKKIKCTAIKCNMALKYSDVIITIIIEWL